MNFNIDGDKPITNRSSLCLKYKSLIRYVCLQSLKCKNSSHPADLTIRHLFVPVNGNTVKPVRREG